MQRECLRFGTGVAEASGLSSKMIKRQFSVTNVRERKIKVYNALQKATEIGGSVYHLVSMKEKAVRLPPLGFRRRHRNKRKRI